MKYDKLLAKSPSHGREVTLLQHTLDVIAAAEALYGVSDNPTRLGRCWLRFFKLDASKWQEFHANLIAACALHDWGKANDGFQDEIRGKRGSQAIRHEHLSALLIGLPQVTQWLQAATPALDVSLVLSAVMTHHLKAGTNLLKRHGFAVAENGLSNFTVLHLSDEFRGLVTAIRRCLCLQEFELTSISEQWSFKVGAQKVGGIRKQIQDHLLQPLHRDLQCNNCRRRMLHAVRAALISADAAGSGLTRVGETIPQWVQSQFSEEPYWNGPLVWERIIQRRIDDLNQQFAERNKPPFEWNAFQTDCEELPERALLLAPCGSGKTLAAWRWIAAQAAKQPVGRLLFLYPTRATAKEGFRDYVSWAPGADAALMHGTSAFDLRGMFDNEADPRHGLSYEADRRLFALGFWPKRAFSATVDQFLAFMQYGYGPLCMLPVLADSVVVIDEIHSFDAGMFSALKSFLTNFQVPVLCMTATLPSDRRTKLESECGLQVYSERPGELETIANCQRYRLTQVQSRDVAAERVKDALAAEHRVLWVVNTVARCHEIVQMFAAGFDPTSLEVGLSTASGRPIYCYHSRFRLADRVTRHGEVVDNMKATSSSGLGVTTQVCEMSLDLDVDLLVTEECPVTSLIQRMGRCNRDRVARPLARSGQVIVYKPSDQNPYTPDDMTGLGDFLDLVRDRDLSQSSLELALGQVKCPPPSGDKLSQFLESGPYALRCEDDFRDSEDYNRQCVLFDDVAAYLNTTGAERPGFVLPVPQRFSRARDDVNESRHAILPRHLGVAFSGHYHPAIGYFDRSLEQWGHQ